MLEARLQKARRLLDLHRDLQRLEEEAISGLRRREAELQAAREDLVGSLGDDAALQRLLMPVIVRRLKSIAEESALIAGELDCRLQALQAVATRAKHAERLSRAYEGEHARVRAERELRDIIERIARPGDASLP